VLGADLNGCVDTAGSIVTVNTQLIVDAGVDDTVCIGNSIVLTASGGASGTTYSWSPSAGLSASTGANPTFTAGTTTTYTVTGTDPTGCQGTDEVIITVPADITLAAAGFATSCNGVCDGQLVVLPTPNTGAFATYTYLWASGGYNSASVQNVCAGDYTVTVTNNAGCVATTTASVTEPSPVIASASGITNATCNAVCDGAATITASGGSNTFTYSWSGPYSGSNPTNLCAGNYTCTVNDANNCSVPVAVSITQPTAITASVTPVSTICIGQSVSLTATAGGGSGGYVYSWTGGTTPTNSATVSASPTVNTVYTVSVTDANGCTPAIATVSVSVNPPLSVTASADATICEGQSSSLSANGSGGNGSLTYTWQTGTTPTTGTSVSATPTITTTYTVIITDGCGTTPASDVVIINVNPLPVLSILVFNPSGCAPVDAEFTAISSTTIQTLNWVFTDMQVSTVNPTPPITFSIAGTYGATLSVTDVNGCSSILTDPNLVTVYPVPDAEFTFSPDSGTALNPQISFFDATTGDTISSWLWNFGNPEDSSSALQNPTFDFQNVGNYDVWLTVTSDNGCIDSVNHTVIISPEFVIYVPNAFTPNADELNETFFPKGVGIDTDHYQMWIYDRWGNQIFTTTDWAKGWDGKVQGHNNLVEEDVYVWKIKLKTWKGEKKSYVGHVTVVR
jgi:large repetitive protein